MTVIYCFMIRQRGLKWMRGRSTFASCRRERQDMHDRTHTAGRERQNANGRTRRTGRAQQDTLGRTRSAGRARQDADKDPEDKEDIEE